MPQGSTSPLLCYLRNLGSQETLKNVSDGELLRRFTAEHDETAFTVMVRRHGGTVLQVCRSLLHNHADAEDAFQATFVVLARQARAIRNKASLASWLYGVAYRTCLKARTAKATRKHHEAQVRPAAAGQAEDELTWREAQSILHHELARLPEKYQAPLVLCYLQGKRQDEAERLLGWRAGKLRSMLERARQRLRAGLARRGLGPCAILLAAVGDAFAAPAPRNLVDSTARAAAALALRPGQAGLVSAQVLSLAETVIQTMPMRKFKLIACGLVLLAGLACAGMQQDPVVVAQERTGTLAAAPLSAAAPSKTARLAKLRPIGVRASSFWDHNAPQSAFDGNRQTMWNAGNYAPQWIEADLGSSMRLGDITLIVIQLPACETTHEIWLSDEPIDGPSGQHMTSVDLPGGFPIPQIPEWKETPQAKRARLVHTLRGFTNDNQTLYFDFPKDTVARHVQVRTTRSESWVAWVEIEIRAAR
jgi:RNA polymerase sigma factor (sigma-70 family)